MPIYSSFLSPSGPSNLQNGDQFREYYVPAMIVHAEQELMDHYGTDRLAHALHKIHEEFYLMIELLQGYAEAKEDQEDCIYFLLAEKLKQPLARLGKACSLASDWTLVAKRSVAGVAS